MPLAVVLAIVTGSGIGSAPAQGLRLHSYVVRAFQLGVSCLNQRLCVAVGATARSDDVQIVRDGVPGRVFPVRGDSAGLDAVSCAGAAGCIAVGNPSPGSVVGVVRIGRSGRPARMALVTVPFDAQLTGISCTSVTGCAVVGSSGQSFVAGWWNGRSLAIHRLGLPPGVSNQSDEIAVSCWRGGSCIAVATGQRDGANTGLFVRLRNGRPGRLRLDRGYSFLGVDCLNARLCYAAGYHQRGGVVVTLRDGVPFAPRHLVAGMFAIACSRSRCTAAGVETGPPPDQGTTVGVLAMVSAGRVTSTAVVKLTAGYLSVARIGRVFVAVGNRPPGSVITSG
jgi:hypothetical protein